MQPEILDLRDARHRERFARLVARSSDGVTQFDTIAEQLRDYVRLQHPAQPLSEQQTQAAIRDVLAGQEVGDFGRWVFYPWSQQLVHVLPPEMFAAVRENRNLHKITLGERDRLHALNVGIVGLSVGSVVARTLALEGIGGRLRLADFDALDLSNLNRLQATIADIGVNKAVLCARQIYETNPYARVETFPAGLTSPNIAQFIDGPPRLDVIIDECDSIDVKIMLREQARARRIPVVMATSDRGMLDVERFDLEPERPLFHGLVGDLRADDVADLTMEQKVEYVLRILSPAEISARGAASMLEIERSILTWPQLASDVQLGGAAVTNAVRRLCLGLAMPSGRRYVDVDGSSESPAGAAPNAARAIPNAARESPTASAVNPLAESILRYAAAAPSAGNNQPWRFVAGEDSVHIACAPNTKAYGDVGGLASYFAVGAAIENALVAATELCSGVELQLFPPPAPEHTVARLGWKAAREDTPRRSEALRLILNRVTNRRLGDGSRLEQQAAAALIAAVQSESVHLELIHDIAGRREIGRLLGRFDRIQFTVQELHAEAMSEMRWTAEEAAQSGDGLEFSTLELCARDLLALRLVARPDVAGILRQPGRGRALEEMAYKAMESSSAVGLIRVNGSSPAAFVEAGRAMQRVWLEATQLGLGIQPWTALTFVSQLLDDPRATIFTGEEQAEVRGLVAGLDAAFAQRADWIPALLFRVSRVSQVTARSRRRPLEQVIVNEPHRVT